MVEMPEQDLGSRWRADSEEGEWSAKSLAHSLNHQPVVSLEPWSPIISLSHRASMEELMWAMPYQWTWSSQSTQRQGRLVRVSPKSTWSHEEREEPVVTGTVRSKS